MPASIPYGRRPSDIRRRSIFIVSPSAIPPIDDTIDYTPDRAVMPSSERVIFRTPVIPGAVRPCKGHAEPAARRAEDLDDRWNEPGYCILRRRGTAESFAPVTRYTSNTPSILRTAASRRFRCCGSAISKRTG